MSHIPSGIWEDMDDSIFVCVICMRRLTNPKVLPCLHRCCCTCLEKQIKGDKNGKVKCVKCKYDVDATYDDANDFKTDFLVHNINKIDKIQKILKGREKESCCNCTRRRPVPKAYCFNCLGYLCDSCRRIHETNPAVQEHRAALLTPEDLLRRDMNCKVMFSRISPKCDTHQNKTASQCCSDCGNKVVCEKCMTESHRSHETKNLTSIVDCSKKELSKSISLLDEEIDNIKKKQEHLEKTSRPILKVVKEKSEALMAARQKEVSKISNRSKFVVAKYENECSELDKSLKSDIRSLQLSMKEEMDMVKAKYDPLISERKAKADIDRQKLEANLGRDRDALNNILKNFETKVQHMSNDLVKVGRENNAIALKMKAHFQQIILRYDDLSITAKSVLAIDSDWIALKCIPMITSAAEVLSKDFDKKFPSVGSLAELPTLDVPQVNLPMMENDEVSPVNEINEGGRKSQTENEMSPFQQKTASIERMKKLHSQSSEENKYNLDGSKEADLYIEKETNLSTWSSDEDRKSQGDEAKVFRGEDQKVKLSSQRSEERATDNPQTGEEGTNDHRGKVTSPIQSRQSTDSVKRKMKVDLNSQSREKSETNPKQDAEAIMEQMKKELHTRGSEEGTRKAEGNATSPMKSRESSAKRTEEVISQQRKEIKHDVKEDREKSLEEEKTVKLNPQNSEDGTSPPIKLRTGSGQQKMEVESHSQISQESNIDPNEPNEVFDEDKEKLKLESQNTGDGTTNAKASTKPPIQPRRGSGKQKFEVDFHSQISTEEGKAGPNETDKVLVEGSKIPRLDSQSSEDGMKNSKGKLKPPIKPRRVSEKQNSEVEFHSQMSQENTKNPNEEGKLSSGQKEKVKKVGGVRVFPPSAI